ncbi:hypothetical protein KN815_27915 [Streptomyces sp. 4503]|uniref:Uncharacterized protein n=1 Tax=Streptomyces niphimycinicus TaxID=2842201 RepID=A0ABS6CLC7_9ACTN|nr:hypothetical protein [Streptomyces niphimycinicus]MBU3867748.1 hypothetical protein [Streptomyces niphimycinicus]
MNAPERDDAEQERHPCADDHAGTGETEAYRTALHGIGGLLAERSAHPQLPTALPLPLFSTSTGIGSSVGSRQWWQSWRPSGARPYSTR